MQKRNTSTEAKIIYNLHITDNVLIDYFLFLAYFLSNITTDFEYYLDRKDTTQNK